MFTSLDLKNCCSSIPTKSIKVGIRLMLIISQYLKKKSIFQPISKREKFSENASYIVTVKSASEEPFFKQLNVTWDIAMINVTDLPQSISYLIEVKTLNDIGESIDSSRITTPLYDSGTISCGGCKNA